MVKPSHNSCLPKIDDTDASLVATIKRSRPDLLKDEPMDGEPIPEDMPAGFLSSQTPQIEDVGQPVTACFFTLSNIDPTNWYNPPLLLIDHSFVNSFFFFS